MNDNAETPLLDQFAALDIAERGAFLGRSLDTQPNQLALELRERLPIAQVSGLTLVAHYRDVFELLNDDQTFSVRAYDAKMQPLVGMFILGTGDGIAYERDLAVLRLSVNPQDMGRITQLTRAFVQDALIAAAGTLDVVDQYARLIPARLLETYFGITGADRSDLIRWCKTMFHEIFLNNERDPLVFKAAQVSKLEMESHINTLITAQHAAPGVDDTVLGRLIDLQKSPASFMSDERIRQNLIGLAVGVIDTTLKSAVYAIDELLRRPDALAMARQAIQEGDEVGLHGCIQEALRFKPQNDILMRICERDYLLGAGTAHETVIPAGNVVLALVYSANRDERVFQNPEAFLPDRPEDQYLHFGAGLHECLGRHIARVQVREMVKGLVALPNLRRQPDAAGELAQNGPFPVSLGVSF